MSRTTNKISAWKQNYFMLQIISLACLLIKASGFGATSTSSPFLHIESHVSSRYKPRALCLSRQSLIENLKCTRDYAPLTKRTSCKSGLFHSKRSKSTDPSKMQMATADNSNDVSNSNNSYNPLVEVWIWFKQLLAKIWRLLTKPFQSKDSEDDGTAIESAEPAQEEVAQMENVAVVEDRTKIELKNLLSTAEVVTEKAEKISKQVKQTQSEPVVTTIDSSTNRQATASPTVDLSGNWTLIVDDAFKSQYDDYLRKLGQPMLVRTVALTVIGSTKEETKQMEDGQQLFIKGTNVRGSWERILEASETNLDGKSTEHAVEGHVLKPMVTADDEEVEVASWWEDDGTVHKSWVVGGKKYGGGDFENKRYLTDDGNILVCESIFHPNEAGREKATVTWRFLREGAMYGEEEFHLPNPFEMFEKKEESAPATKESGVVVGDIMDDVATSADEKLSPSESVEQYIDQGGWVPPVGKRWALAAPGVDLSGKWKLIITEKFKEDYAEFLKSLGQPAIVVGAAVLLVGNTREETRQSDRGRSLYIRGINTKGIWERTLIASGSDFEKAMTPQPDGTYNHTQVPIVTADAENVLAESWWEDDGTKHVSWTLGVKKYGSGSFESKRYLENNGDVYVCESTFHPNDTENRKKSQLTWRFLREGATVFVGDK